MRSFCFGVCVALCCVLFAGVARGEGVREAVYAGELAAYPGQWAFQLGKQGLILVNDQQLDDLTDPDKAVDLSLTGEPRVETLRQVCERAERAGQRTIMLAFDHFFNQYRPGHEDTPRRYTPDTPEYIERVAKISAFAAGYGLGLELSLLSPLEIGPGYQQQTGNAGVWMHYRKGLRDAASGAYSVELWRQERWSNNKGPIDVADAGVRVFAFREQRQGQTPYRVVDPAGIVEISGTAEVEVYEGLARKQGDYVARRVRIHGSGQTEIGPLDRVLVVQEYTTPELDYFNADALPFLTGLVDRYADAGVKLNGLYADEMHIQQNWGYHGHHDHGQFALRYVTPALADAYAARYGEEYRDFAKYMVYFAYGQEDTASDLSALQGASHVFRGTPEGIHATALFRARYYRLLQDTVVDLFTNAKRHAEARMGHHLEARAHATWAQSPTIDRWDVESGRHMNRLYEYTPDFLWSNTVQQAAAACYDYFKWGDFLTGNGNDHAEGGWLDRNYYGLAVACSTGSINAVPYSYGAHWGMPHELSRRRQAIVDVFGASSGPQHALVQEMEHRDVDVLMLYPMDLVAVEERFGSWMNQYAYANLITQQKLTEMGSVEAGKLVVNGRRYSTLVALFEPFPEARLLAMMDTLSQQGGTVIWSGSPPLLTAEGGDARTPWEAIFGVSHVATQHWGESRPGWPVVFAGALAGVPEQSILTHFLVDRIYPVAAGEGVQVCAQVGDAVVGARRAVPGGGQAVYLGFRPRDDQSASLGQEQRVWFEVLSALGAYAPTGKFPGGNDNTEHVSRTTDYVACRFPNGTTALARHFRDVIEDWPGGFARNAEEDAAYLARVPPPTEAIALAGMQVNGHTVTYSGDGAVSFRSDDAGQLVAFAGRNTTGITLDGQAYSFADSPLALLAFAPMSGARRVAGGAVFQLQVHGSGEVRIPVRGIAEGLQLFAEGAKPGSRGREVPSRMEAGMLIFDAATTGHGWLYLAPSAQAS